MNPILLSRAKARRTLATLAVSALLAACSLPGNHAAMRQVYDFGAPSSEAGAAAPAKTARVLLGFGGVSVASQLDSTEMNYRLLYGASNQMHAYGESQWAMPPAELVGQRLIAHLSGHYVVVGADEGRRDAILLLQMDAFEQDFMSADQSDAVVSLRATLVKSDGTALAQTTVAARRPSASANASGGAKALAEASDAVADTLLAWIDDTLAHARH
jgi:cholesterol transport system auxiliary component